MEKRALTLILSMGISVCAFATDARCFVDCGVPIAIAGTLGGNGHGDDEWADPKTFDLFGEWLSRFLVNPDKYAAP